MGGQPDDHSAISSPRERPRTFTEILARFAIEDLDDPAVGFDTSNPSSRPLLSGQQFRTDPVLSQVSSELGGFTRHCKSFLQLDQLQHLTLQYSHGGKDFPSICEEMIDRAGRSIKPSKLTVTKY
jgi:hypothetical protein